MKSQQITPVKYVMLVLGSIVFFFYVDHVAAINDQYRKQAVEQAIAKEKKKYSLEYKLMPAKIITTIENVTIDDQNDLNQSNHLCKVFVVELMNKRQVCIVITENQLMASNIHNWDIGKKINVRIVHARIFERHFYTFEFAPQQLSKTLASKI